MMNFRIVKESIVNNILIPGEKGQYKTLEYQTQGMGAEQILGNDRTAFVYYFQGDFDGRRVGTQTHKITFNIELAVSSQAKMDLAALENADPAVRATAIANLETAGKINDESLDEFIDIIWNLIMAGNNDFLGIDETKYPDLKVTNRYINSVQKDEPVQRGAYVVNTAIMKLVCNLFEQPPEKAGAPPSGTYDNTIYPEDSEIENTGIITENT